MRVAYPASIDRQDFAAVVEAENAATGPLGLVHRHVGMPRQGVEIATVLGIDGDTEAGSDFDLVPENVEGLQQGIDNIASNTSRILTSAQIAQQGHELVAPLARHGIAFTDAAAQATRHQAQKFIPR